MKNNCQRLRDSFVCDVRLGDQREARVSGEFAGELLEPFGESGHLGWDSPGAVRRDQAPTRTLRSIRHFRS